MINIDIGATAVAILTLFGIYSLMAISLNLEYGVAGVPNFGQALFVSIGAYVRRPHLYAFAATAGGHGSHTPLPPDHGSSAAIALGDHGDATRGGFHQSWIHFHIRGNPGRSGRFAVSYVTLRLKEEWFLALVLLVGGEIVRIVVRGADDLICSHNGISGVASPFIFWTTPARAPSFSCCWRWSLAAIAYLYSQRLVQSPYGRMLKGLRENEDVTRGLGKGISLARAQIMLIGSMIAAVGGVLFALNTGFVNTNDYVVTLTLDIWVMVVLGGVGNNRGAVLGALLIALMDRFTQIAAIAMNMSGSPIEFNYARFILFGVILLLMLRYRPQGLLPESPLTTNAHDVLRRRR